MIDIDNMHQLVRVVDGAVVADSRDVAEAFERRHDHVLRAIQDLIVRRADLAPTFGGKVARVNIGSGAQRDSHYYTMNRKGFVVLVGGFKGDRALDFRIAFYDAFERMEAMLERMAADAAVASAPSFSLDAEQMRISLQMVREARAIGGKAAARRAWDLTGLPDVFDTDAPIALARPADPVVAAWLRARVEFVPGARTPTSWLYEDYQECCASTGEAAIGLSEFGRHLNRLGVPHKMSNGSQRLGVRLRPIGEVAWAA